MTSHELFLYTSRVFVRRRDAIKASTNRVTLPVYLNATRAQLLFTVDLEARGEGSGEGHSFYERGVGLVTSSLGA